MALPQVTTVPSGRRRANASADDTSCAWRTCAVTVAPFWRLAARKVDFPCKITPVARVKHPTAVVKPRGEIYMTWSPNSPLLPESFQVRAVFDNIWPCLTFGQIWACSTWLRDQSFQSYFQAELCLKSQIFHRGIWRQGNHATTATEQRDGEGDGHGGHRTRRHRWLSQSNYL